MPTYLYPFSGGSAAIAGWGDRWDFLFSSVGWVANDRWTVTVTSTIGDFVIGAGNLGGLVPTICFTYRDRMYLASGTQVNFSDNGDVTAWEQQDPGAGFFNFMSQFGQQDSINGLSQFQGKLVVLGTHSIQIWTVDADPAAFSVFQTLNNIGTSSPLSVWNLGDYDVFFVDATGVRSLRAREVTNNAYVDDIGSPVDALVQTHLVGLDLSTICGVVDPTVKTYWVWIKDRIYVLSRFLGSKIAAWSTFTAQDQVNADFTPQKFVVQNNQVFIRSTEGYFIAYGGANGATYDLQKGIVVTLPWLDDKRPGTFKQMAGIQAVIQGQWAINGGTDPISGLYDDTILVNNPGSPPNSLTDSTYDTGLIPWTARGTHFSLELASTPTSTTVPTKLSSLVVYYNLAEVP